MTQMIKYLKICLTLKISKTMKKLSIFIIIYLFTATTIITFTSCQKKGCTDPNANNYDTDAKKDDGTCTYPTVTFRSGGVAVVDLATGDDVDGDVEGAGGTASDTIIWDSNSKPRGDYSMDITAASGGSFQFIVKDAGNTVVLNQTLTSGVGDDSKSGVSASGTAGIWTLIIHLTDFSGDGSFSISPEN